MGNKGLDRLVKENDSNTELMIFMGFFTAVLYISTYNLRSSDIIPKVREVQHGYVAPGDMRIEVGDIDKNRGPEMLFYIRDKPYFLLYDENGNPTISEYKPK